MADTIKRGSTRIRYEGVFDWNELYSLMTGWFGNKKFDYYEEKNVKKIGVYGYEREFEAHAEREESGYVRHDIDIKIKCFHTEDVEIIEKGEKKHMNKVGMMIIDIEPKVVLDWQDKWDKSFKKKARDFFHKYIIEGYAYEQMDKVYYESYKLHTEIKKLLKLEGKYSAY